MRSRKAFTLIELLVVIAIIAALISMLVPACAAARRLAQTTACQAKLKEVSKALWAYSVSNDSRVPYVVSPMTNTGFGDASKSDADLDPYDPDKWPDSFQNKLMPLYLGEDRKMFICPAANRGWPRNSGSFQMTYRDAAINQPSGTIVEDPLSYNRNAFAFLDGRPMVEMRPRFTGNLITDAQMFSYMRGTFLRDMVLRESGSTVIGPHDRGINVINREFGVEFRDAKSIKADLTPNGQAVLF
jgi:prepilin-type N-terminal cleavage/methylation domain-containing protein